MCEPPHITSGDLESFVNGEIDTSVRYDDVASFGERWDYGRDGRKGLRVHDGGFGAEERGNVRFEFHVDVWGGQHERQRVVR